ncbi:FxSxx-COOH system tetratricopeptide repeat protein [Actinoplanes missouriensis]|uniref:FxSxx-COOH system tetratricopeptide repeat protein n=1 Tax=Actinoplanes missouriensis TaxID=1866 RepID=UPI0033C700E3
MMGIGLRRRWTRVAWIAGALTLAAVLVAAAIRQDWLDGRQSGAVWTWLERVSWLAALAGLVIAVLATRRSAAPSPVVQDAKTPEARNLPPRNPAFVGRADVLKEIKDGLTAHNSLVIQALHGWGGVGKTQLAIEYAHRHLREYDVIWWFAAEHPQLLGEQYAQLAVAVGVATPETDTAVAVNLARRFLRERSRWLLVFDNAEDPAILRDWLPDGDGHVLITSRRRDWYEVAEPISVDVLSHAESMAMLKRGPAAEAPDVGGLARELGGLPLALAQAAGFMAETGMSAGDYLSTLVQRPHLLLDEGLPASYPAPLTATVTKGAERAEAADPAAAQLLRLAATCGPEPVPLWLFADGALPEPLASTAAQPLALRRSVGLLVRLGLARADADSMQLHRLTRMILRSSETDQARRDHRVTVERLLIAALPSDDDKDPANWPVWSALAPHILALDPVTSDSAGFRHLAAWWVGGLLNRGSLREGLHLAEQLHDSWQRRHGPEEETTLHAAHVLGYAFYLTGRWHEARDIDERTYQVRLRVLGPDNQLTQLSANNLGGSLGRLGQTGEAIALYQELVGQLRRQLGAEHRDTLRATGNLALELRKSGDVPAAMALHESTWASLSEVVGTDHPETLISAREVGIDWRLLGEPDRSREILRETFRRSVKILGQDHPETLKCAHELACTLRELGERREARTLLADTHERRRKLLGDDHPDTRESAEAVAEV